MRERGRQLPPCRRAREVQPEAPVAGVLADRRAEARLRGGGMALRELGLAELLPGDSRPGQPARGALRVAGGDRPVPSGGRADRLSDGRGQWRHGWSFARSATRRADHVRAARLQGAHELEAVRRAGPQRLPAAQEALDRAHQPPAPRDRAGPRGRSCGSPARPATTSEPSFECESGKTHSLEGGPDRTLSRSQPL